VPQLGGQIYAMPGMSTELNLIANKIGTYDGSSANISGEGFAGMTFSVKSSTNTDFSNWVQSVKHTNEALNTQTYNNLSRPSQNNPTFSYGYAEQGLYNAIVTKYNSPDSQSNNYTPIEHGDSQMEGMTM
jgi:cytochrome o ubiquinol oxidase subunit 2